MIKELKEKQTVIDIKDVKEVWRCCEEGILYKGKYVKEVILPTAVFLDKIKGKTV